MNVFVHFMYIASILKQWIFFVDNLMFGVQFTCFKGNSEARCENADDL